ncbi:792_t:CDS:2, partial [Diversispora eburnea]
YFEAEKKRLEMIEFKKPFVKNPGYEHPNSRYYSTSLSSMIESINSKISGGNNSNEAFYVDLSSSFDVNSPPWVTLTSIGGKCERSSVSIGGQSLSTIYVIGGYQYSSNVRSNIANNLVYTFDTASESWDSVTISSLEKRSRTFAVGDSEGYIYIFGGSDNNIRMDNMSIVDSLLNTVSETSFTDGPTPRSDYTATLVDKYIVYIGGVEGTQSSSSQLIWIFDTSSSEWVTSQAVGPEIGSRMGHTATLGSNGRIFVYGGITLSSVVPNPSIYFAVLDVTVFPYQWSVPELNDESNEGSKKAALIGGILGALLFVIIIIGIGIFFYLRRKRRRGQESEKSEISKTGENFDVADVHGNEVIESSSPTQPQIVNRPSSTMKKPTNEEHRDEMIILSESAVPPIYYPNINKDNFTHASVPLPAQPPLDPSVYNATDIPPTIYNATDVPPTIYNTTD